MRFLIDEMFSPRVAEHLAELGHEARHVRDLGLMGATDDEVLLHASVEDRVVVTENAADFVPLVDAAMQTGQTTPPVVLGLKRTLPSEAGAVANELARRLHRWAVDHPEPYRHVHWLR